MRRIARMGLLIVLPATFLAQAPDRSAMNCVAELWVPEYNVLAWQARVQGTYSVVINIGDQGTALKLLVSSSTGNGGGILLEREVERAVKKSTFKHRCRGTQVVLRFTFLFDGDLSEYPRTVIKYRPPEEFLLIARPPLPLNK